MNRMMINIFVCDDNKIALKEIEDHITKACNSLQIKHFQVISYINELMLISDIEDGSAVPDIIFLDIKLQKINGISIAKRIKHKLPVCQIVFVSGYDDYYLDVYDADHIYFLKKPLQGQAVLSAIEKALSKLKKEKEKMFSFSSNGKMALVPISQITHFEKERRKVIIHTQNQEKYDYYDKMDELISRLGEEFVRCHNSYVVNMYKIRELSRDKITLSDSIEVPVSRFYQQTVKSQFIDFIEQKLKD